MAAHPDITCLFRIESGHACLVMLPIAIAPEAASVALRKRLVCAPIISLKSLDRRNLGSQS